jgi:5-methylcytosine-specific restriction protein A
MTYYIQYLKKIRKVSDATVKHYQGALRTVSKFLVQKGKIQDTVYEIKDIYELEIVRTYLFSNPEFIELNKRGHQMYSAAVNNYYKFANGNGFSDIHKKIEVMDIEVPVAKKEIIQNERWKRSSIIKTQTIESAGYECEIDPKHSTFTAKSTGHPYMEGHHLLPMKFQNKFEKSLDIYANVVCLCPICHRMLHYGIASEKKASVDKLYVDRANRLETSGIRISKSDFERLVLQDMI